MPNKEELSAVYLADLAARKAIAEGADENARAAASAGIARAAFAIKKVKSLYDTYRITEEDAGRIHAMMIEATLPEPAIMLDDSNALLAGTLFFIDKEKPLALLERLAQIEVNLPEGTDREAKFEAWRPLITMSAVTLRDQNRKSMGQAKLAAPIRSGCLALLPLMGWFLK